MRRMVVAGSLLGLLMWCMPQQVNAQDTKSARGTVTAMAGDSLSVKAGTQELKFMIDGSTVVTAEGGSTASRAAAAQGKGGPKLADLIKVGDAVEVAYHEKGMHATSVRKVPSAGSGGGTTSDARAAEKTESASGTVEVVSGTSLTITGSGGGGSTFKQTYTIDASTRVVGSGVGTAAAAKGGKVSFTDHVGKGDRVTVQYHATGNTLHASEVRITQKASK
jgi:Domain of unknown function (DUF5666)